MDWVGETIYDLNRFSHNFPKLIKEEKNMSNTDIPSAQMDPYGIGFATGSNDLFGKFLGPAPQLARTDPYVHRNADVWTMPENFKGQNLVLSDTLEDWMFTADQNVYTQRLLPWRVTEQVSMQWEQFEANAHVMPMVAYMTPSPLVTQKRKFMRAKLVRRGIAAQFEHDFLRTPLGRSSFLAALGQMGRSVQETANLDCVRALVGAHSVQEQHLRDLNIPTERLMSDIRKRDVERFAIVQKVKNGLEILDMQIASEMHSYRGQANAYLVPESVSIYATIVRPEKTDYYLAGQEGPNRVNGVGGISPSGGTGPAVRRFEPQLMIRGNDGYIAKMLHVDGMDRDQEELLARVRQTGEYYQMLDEEDDDYKSSHRDIFIYDEDVDEMVRIRLVDAVIHAGIWDENTKNEGYKVKTVRRSPELQLDLEQDFLSVYDTKKEPSPVEYVFDIHPDYLPTEFLIRAGQCIERSRKEANGEEDLDSFLNNIGLKMLEALPNQEPVTDQSENQDSGVSERIQSGVMNMMSSVVPDTHTEQIRSTFSGPGSFESRMEAAREKILNMVRERVPGMKVRDEAPANAFCNKAIAGYQEKMAQLQRKNVRATGQNRGLADMGQYIWQESTVEQGVKRQQQERVDEDLYKLHEDKIDKYPVSEKVREAAKKYLNMKVTRDNVVGMVNANIVPPMNFILFRPHQQYQTQTIVKCQQDGGCGYTFIGNSNLIIGHTAGTKMAHMNYTTHMRSVITQPKNVYVQPDVMVTRCEGGAGSRFWSPTQYVNQYDPDDLVASLISVACPPAERSFPCPMDTSGRFYTEYRVSLTSAQRAAPLHYSTAGRYNQMYKFYSREDDRARMGPGRHHYNRLCYQGHQVNYNTGTKTHDRVIVNKGHWGKNTYAGCKPVREGAARCFEEQNYSMSHK